MTQVTIPNSVTTIRDNAFFNCYRLTSVTIPGSVTTFGNNAFLSCTNLASVTIGGGATRIGDNAFDSCSRLASVTIPDSVTHIGAYAFRSCTSLISVNIPANVSHIGGYAFYECTKLASVILPDSVTYLGNYAFARCTDMTDATLGSGIIIDGFVSGSGHSSFRYCSSLKSVTFHNNLTNFTANEVFGESIGALKHVVIGDGIPSIPRYAFANCAGLTSVTIGAGVTSIGLKRLDFAHKCHSRHIGIALLLRLRFNQRSKALLPYRLAITQIPPEPRSPPPSPRIAGRRGGRLPRGGAAAAG